MFPNIYVVGAQSTGKTTLVNALESHFADAKNRIQNGVHVPAPGVIREVARSVLTQHNFSRDDIRTSTERCLELQRHILAAQWQQERLVLSQSRWFISDRSGLDPITYAQKFGGKSAACILLDCESWHELKERLKSSVVVVCRPETEFLKDDGVRLMPEDIREWEDLHSTFCNILEENGVEYFVRAGVMSAEEYVRMIRMLWDTRFGCNTAGISDSH
ncbi:hypothetical protein SLS58_002891 [Diplodia intermedia]|uniref:NadR/Ttd14 AAA domain-containing protein n=1 Tax=Diplodia intermedia TaxID=856260 RepID=A0ABR3TXX6_9PEZI